MSDCVPKVEDVVLVEGLLKGWYKVKVLAVYKAHLWTIDVKHPDDTPVRYPVSGCKSIEKFNE